MTSSDKSVFLVTELWLIPGSFPKLKQYRRQINDILEKFRPTYIFHNHPFEWVAGENTESYPTGIEIIKFESEKLARAALAALDTEEIKAIEIELFHRVRCYLSRYDFPDSLTAEIFNKIH